jgi:hypothetical protein
MRSQKFSHRFAETDSARFYLGSINQIWSDPNKVKDVTEAIWQHIYQESAPERIYLPLIRPH